MQFDHKLNVILKYKKLCIVLTNQSLIDEMNSFLYASLIILDEITVADYIFNSAGAHLGQLCLTHVVWFQTCIVPEVSSIKTSSGRGRGGVVLASSVLSGGIRTTYSAAAYLVLIIFIFFSHYFFIT